MRMKKSIPDIVRNTIVTFTYLIVVIYLAISCGHKKENLSPHIIPLESAVGDYHILNLSDYATDIRYVPIETQESSLIGGMRQIVYENEQIIISDDINNCYLFDNNGKFIRKIGSAGRGPNEYLYIPRVYVHNNLIFLNDRSKLIIYDTNGFLIDNINLWSSDLSRSYIVRNVLPLSRDTFVMDVVTLDNEYYPKAILFESYQLNAKPIKEYPSSVKLDKVAAAFSISDEEAIMYRFKDEIRTYKYINCDTLFTIGQDTEMKSAFIFELGQYRPTLSYLEFRDGPDGGMNFIRPANIFESINHLFIEFSFAKYAPEPFKYTYSFPGSDPRERTNYNVCGVFDKSSGQLTLMKQSIKGKLGLKNDVDDGPIIWPHYISSNNELVTYISAKDFLDYFNKIEEPSPQLIEISKQIGMDDNPIAIIAKLKT